MKHQISISIFLAIVVIMLALLYIKFSNDTQLNDNGVLTEDSNKNDENALEISSDYVSYAFYVKDDNGRLVVYDTKTQSVYAQTGILTKVLPLEIQQELEAGIYFKTEGELYNFLESYSS